MAETLEAHVKLIREIFQLHLMGYLAKNHSGDINLEMAVGETIVSKIEDDRRS